MCQQTKAFWKVYWQQICLRLITVRAVIPENSFSSLEIAKDENFEEHLNKYDTIFLNMQEFLSRSSNVKELLERVEGQK